jgi:hypothetical protein
MADPSPWTFGWTQLLTIAGLSLTGYIGCQGLRTFNRWRREKIEEKRIEVAIDALAAAYKSKFVFEYIRGAFIPAHEFQDMPERAGESDSDRGRREGTYAVLKRIERNQDFFDHVWELQPKFMAVFGEKTGEIFDLLHAARRDIQVACDMVAWMTEPERDNKEEWELLIQLRQDIWSSTGKKAKEGDRVGKKLEDFRTRIETLCRPIVDRELRTRQ